VHQETVKDWSVILVILTDKGFSWALTLTDPLVLSVKYPPTIVTVIVINNPRIVPLRLNISFFLNRQLVFDLSLALMVLIILF